MNDIDGSTISFVLNKIAVSLDISETAFEEAEARYKAIGAWLGEGNSPLARFSPQIYAQGSFLLGTVTKPLGDNHDYDIDLVFEMTVDKSEISQKTLKGWVGERLRAHEVYRRLLDAEGRRCWTLQYAETARLHLDILPAIPDNEFVHMLRQQGVSPVLAGTGIAITDNTMSNYEQICPDWPRCNPKGYANWFRQRMIVQFAKQQRSLQESLKAEVENVPDYRIKTPLQRCIQLLKRHRDIMFEKDKDNRPASIIITTLAGRAYGNEGDMVAALERIVEGMPMFISRQDGVSWVANPVDPTENFADRWKDCPGREPRFMEWLTRLRDDVAAMLQCTDVDDLERLLASLFGERLSGAAVSEYRSAGTPRIGAVPSRVATAPRIVSIHHPDKPWGGS